MEIAVLSSDRRTEDEISVLMSMFKMGLKRFHLWKPRYSTKEMEEYLDSLPPTYRSRIVIHSHHELALKYGLGGIHLSKSHRRKRLKRWWRLFWYRKRAPELCMSRTCHDPADLIHEKGNYDHLILSPIFQGISSKSHGGGYSERSIRSVLERTPYLVYALGGVTPERLPRLAEMGFYGGILAGAIWEEEKDRAKILERALDKVKEIDGNGSGTKEAQEPTVQG